MPIISGVGSGLVSDELGCAYDRGCSATTIASPQIPHSHSLYPTGDLGGFRMCGKRLPPSRGGRDLVDPLELLDPLDSPFWAGVSCRTTSSANAKCQTNGPNTGSWRCWRRTSSELLLRLALRMAGVMVITRRLCALGGGARERRRRKSIACSGGSQCRRISHLRITFCHEEETYWLIRGEVRDKEKGKMKRKELRELQITRSQSSSGAEKKGRLKGGKRDVFRCLNLVGFRVLDFFSW